MKVTRLPMEKKLGMVRKKRATEMVKKKRQRKVKAVEERVLQAVGERQQAKETKRWLVQVLALMKCATSSKAKRRRKASVSKTKKQKHRLHTVNYFAKVKVVVERE